MISWPLFKQSVKANFTRWLIVTFASCFIVAVVILILGNLNVGEIRKSLEDMFEKSDKQAQIQSSAIDGYEKTVDMYNEVLENYKKNVDTINRAVEGTIAEDEYASFSDEFKDAIKKLRNGESEIASAKTQLSTGEAKLESSKKAYNASKSEYTAKLETLKDQKQQLEEGISKSQGELSDLKTKLTQVNTGIEQVNLGISQAPDEATKVALQAKLETLQGQKAQIEAGVAQYEAGIADAQGKLTQVNAGITQINSGLSSGQKQLTEAENKIDTSKQQLTSAQNTLASSKTELKTKAEETIVEEILKTIYDKAIEQGNDEETATKTKNAANDIINRYKNNEATDAKTLEKLASNYVADTIYDEAIKENSEEDSKTAKSVAVSAISDYNTKIEEGSSKEEAKAEISKSLIEQLPEDVGDAIIEIKDLNIYALVIGNILFRIAGLLLPMIFVIMTANNLIAGQVDSGSMAYVLSTPTRRFKVAFTQMVYLIVSILLMYVLVGVTGAICTNFVTNELFTITAKQVVMFSIGAFFVIFAISGICYLASAIFNREKNSLSVGGGITMFFLVCSILGLFGEKVIPSAIRIEAMNYFNYASIISFFNVNSIIAGTNEWLKGLVYLFAIGIVCYIIGIRKFDKKDLPL